MQMQFVHMEHKDSFQITPIGKMYSKMDEK